MRYIEVKIYTTQEGIDPLTCILMDMGIAGFVIEDAGDFQDLMNKKNSYDWDYVDESLMELANVETNITFYLEDISENSGLIKVLQERITELKSEQNNAHEAKRSENPDLGDLRLISKIVDDEDWKDNWKKYFKPAKVTDHIVIKPTWEEYDSQENELVIEIDPGMAFGTGTHPTTSLCIRLLEKYIEPDKDAVLDVGCGSGILSIAAALLGAEDILAVDIDPVAVEVSKENIELNGLASKIQVKEGDLTKGLNVKADIVVANLMADLVIMLSKDVAGHLKGKGIYISSGILIEKQAEVAAAIRECGFKIIEILEEGEWCAIAAQL
jgi:ribosomal protein L11 methyltransferase